MDDNTTLRAEFTIGDHKVTAAHPTGEQLFVLQLTRQAQSAKEGVRTARRLVRILEALLGQDQWDSVMEAGLIDGSITVEQMMELAREIFGFNWSSLEAEPDVTTMSTPLPTEAVNTYENEIADALAAGE